MRIAVVVQRFGADIFGGAELHCRYIVEHLREQHDITVLTTCARDYLTWYNEYESGEYIGEGYRILRFTTEPRENREYFDHLAYKVSYCPHTDQDELAWIRELGPVSPELITYLRDNNGDYDCFIFFSFRYATVFFGLPLVAKKSILVPTAENDRIIHLSVFKEFFKLPAAIAYNSIEERELINSVTGNSAVPGVTVGVGLSGVQSSQKGDYFRKYDLRRPYIIYVGRMEEVKGCAFLASSFIEFCERFSADFDLVFIGSGNFTLPDHVQMVHLQDVCEADKMAIIGKSRLLVMPSPRESLSMVLLEAWAMKRPVLVNGDCPVLRGQCLRSNGGLYYRNKQEFILALNMLLSQKELGEKLGIQGHDYYQQHYLWPIIMKKYDELLSYISAKEGPA